MRKSAFLIVLIAWPLSAVQADTSSTADQSRANGRKFYTEHVLPKLAENGCQKCHAVGYVHPNVLIYEELLPYLAMGATADRNDVIRKLANLRPFAPDRPTHPGGQRCPSIEADPCKTILQWWNVEFETPAASNGAAK